MMKLSDQTLNVLKNFATINSQMVLTKGNVQKIMSGAGTVLAEAVMSEEFPIEEFGIYDLNKFIVNVSTLKNPELTFKDLAVLISDGDTEMTYYGAASSVIAPKGTPKTAKLMATPMDLEFVVPKEKLQQILRMAALNNLEDILIVGEDKKLYLRATTTKYDTSNVVNIYLCDYDGKDFICVFEITNMKMMLDDYTVKLAFDGLSIWTNKSQTLKYFIAIKRVKK